MTAELPSEVTLTASEYAQAAPAGKLGALVRAKLDFVLERDQNKYAKTLDDIGPGYPNPDTGEVTFAVTYQAADRRADT